jgi:hypothetical protein
MLKFERRDGSSDEEVYFEDLDEAKEHFDEVNSPDDEDLQKKYCSISLIEVDWYKRANYEIDGMVFEGKK